MCWRGRRRENEGRMRSIRTLVAAGAVGLFSMGGAMLYLQVLAAGMAGVDDPAVAECAGRIGVVLAGWEAAALAVLTAALWGRWRWLAGAVLAAGLIQAAVVGGVLFSTAGRGLGGGVCVAGGVGKSR